MTPTESEAACPQNSTPRLSPPVITSAPMISPTEDPLLLDNSHKCVCEVTGNTINYSHPIHFKNMDPLTLTLILSPPTEPTSSIHRNGASQEHRPDPARRQRSRPSNARKPHKCQQCSWAFRTKDQLKNHSYTHTGHKPYACAFCKLRFAKKYNMKRHVISMHEDSVSAQTSLSDPNAPTSTVPLAASAVSAGPSPTALNAVACHYMHELRPIVDHAPSSF